MDQRWLGLKGTARPVQGFALDADAVQEQCCIDQGPLRHR